MLIVVQGLVISEDIQNFRLERGSYQVKTRIVQKIQRGSGTNF
jgi:hypothetical protein